MQYPAVSITYISTIIWREQTRYISNGSYLFWEPNSSYTVLQCIVMPVMGVGLTIYQYVSLIRVWSLRMVGQAKWRFRAEMAVET